MKCSNCGGPHGISTCSASQVPKVREVAMIDRPKALKLADELDSCAGLFFNKYRIADCKDAAAALREQHAELEKLRRENENYRNSMANKSYLIDFLRRHAREQNAEIERLKDERDSALVVIGMDDGKDNAIECAPGKELPSHKRIL